MEDTMLDEASVIIRHLIDEQGKRDVIAWAERWLKRYESRPTPDAADVLVCDRCGVFSVYENGLCWQCLDG